MNVIKCANGHFFDADTYGKCPHCGAEAASAVGKGTKEKTERRGFALFGQKYSKTTSRTAVNPQQEKPVSQTLPEKTAQDFHESAQHESEASVLTPPLHSEVMAVQSDSWTQQEEKKDVTVDFWQATPTQPPVQTQQIKKDLTVDVWQTASVPVAEELRVSNVQSEVGQTPVADATSGDSLREAIRAASASSEGKTMSYFSTVTSSVPAAAAAAAPVQQGTGDPVVGWLVCIQGPCLGWSFQIGAGNNTIGRKEDNRIVIPNDMKISGIRHASIAYEPKRRNFYLHPGEASGLTYLNDEYITASRMLSSRDIIELGDSKLMFIPLCGEDFSWETYLK